MLAQASDERTVAIPEEIGRRLGIEPGDRLDWTYGCARRASIMAENWSEPFI